MPGRGVTMPDVVLWVGAFAATLAAAASLVTVDPRRRAAAMALALVLASLMIAADSWDDPRLRELRSEPLLVAGIAVASVAVIAALSVLIRRHASALVLLVFAALPFRIPVEAGGEAANLLVPLYVVIAAGVVATLAEGFSRERSPGAGGQMPMRGSAATRWLPAALAAYLVLYALQGTYTDDLSKALENLGFFFVPFAVLASLLMRVEWSPRLLALALAVVVAEAALFAVVGAVQYATGELFWNETIIAANEVHAYFRVNSLFWDPNILGRYLALTVVTLCAVALWARSNQAALAAGAGSLLALAVLTVTFSQSSLIALLAGLAVLAALRWSARWVAALAGIALLGGLIVLIASGPSIGLDPATERTLNVQTSGRAELVRGGVELARERPLAGHGSGSFERRFRGRFGRGEAAASVASHTEPVTVAAEQGAIGVIAYIALIVLALAALASGIRLLAPGLRGGGRGLARAGGVALGTARVATLAGLVVMIVHSISYAAFFTDPITWLLIALGVALARRR